MQVRKPIQECRWEMVVGAEERRGTRVRTELAGNVSRPW